MMFLPVDALMDNTSPNQYDTRGVCNGWYLPGNGGLLYAVAMMAAVGMVPADGHPVFQMMEAGR
jgi:hypothetical protein